ncbi:MAG: hypothetical protein EZS28_023959, partial [Streblomastix strix]
MHQYLESLFHAEVEDIVEFENIVEFEDIVEVMNIVEVKDNVEVISAACPTLQSNFVTIVIIKPMGNKLESFI